MKGQFKVIPQMHLGIRFRSRTEARWAEFFDSQRIPFVYEPDGIGDGHTGYLVDFQLTGAKRPTYFEVKPHKPTPREYQNLVNLARTMKAHVFVAHGPPSGTVQIEKVYSNGESKQWYFAYEHEGTCGYIVDCLYACTHSLALRDTKNPAGMYGIGPASELDKAGSYQFSDPLAARRVRPSAALLRSRIVRESIEREVVSIEKLYAERKVVGRDE
jgi:hypothetical protein